MISHEIVAETGDLFLSTPRAVFLVCLAGMGDALMVMAAAKALKASFNCAVFLRTQPKYVALAKSCEHVDDAYPDQETLDKAIARATASYPPGTLLGVDLTAYNHSISRSHQIDSYLATFGIEAQPHLKELDLRPDAVSDARAEGLIASWPALPAGKGRILIHPAESDPQRTWPRARWEELATHFTAAGHQVVVIGARAPELGYNIHDLAVSGLVSAVDRLEPLETVALMRRADLLVSTDSGAIQLAGATDIGIVGLYSVVAPKNRLPFRHGKAAWNAKGVAPTCPAHPCFEKLRDPATMEAMRRVTPEDALGTLEETLRRIVAKLPVQPVFFTKWCMMSDRYRCMSHELGVSAVLDACRDVLTHRSDSDLPLPTEPVGT